eukprot:TRINITY_DN55841_c0_g1_i1.p1 TRINITY_DN55841_c0_g1~~TRINITY_DN55841_c0_g1_i1.p1  ORF type:complete len:880 (+),score=138.61 TRINITY_DN55841_c0_g1_i1:93-2732(+)
MPFGWLWRSGNSAGDTPQGDPFGDAGQDPYGGTSPRAGAAAAGAHGDFAAEQDEHEAAGSPRAGDIARSPRPEKVGDPAASGSWLPSFLRLRMFSRRNSFGQSDRLRQSRKYAAVPTGAFAERTGRAHGSRHNMGSRRSRSMMSSRDIRGEGSLYSHRYHHSDGEEDLHEDPDGIMRWRPREYDFGFETSRSSRPRSARRMDYAAGTSTARLSEWVHSQARGGESGDHGDPPLGLVISSRDVPDVAGQYVLMEGVQRNGCPVWSRGPWRLFSNSRGFWMVGARRRFDDDVGVLCSVLAHRGMSPLYCTAWERFSSAGTWVPCTRTSIFPADVDPANSRRTAPRTLSVRAVCFVIDAFLRQHAPQRAADPAAAAELSTRVAREGSSLDELLESMCNTYGVHSAQWRGPHYPGALWYRLDCFYRIHAPRHRNKVPGLVDGITSGRYSLERVTAKLCQNFDADPGQWQGDYPPALSTFALAQTSGELFTDMLNGTDSGCGGGDYGWRAESLPTPTTGNRRSTQGPSTGRESLDEVVIEKGANDPLGVVWSDHTVCKSVQPGSAADRCGVERFIGRRLTHLDGQEVHKLADIRSLAQGRARCVLRFAGGLRRDMSWTISVGQQSAREQERAPQELTVICPEGQGLACGGTYSLMRTEVNGKPAWRRDASYGKVHWLYSTPQGRWGITDTSDDFASGMSYVYGAAPHEMGWPHQGADGWLTKGQRPVPGFCVQVSSDPMGGSDHFSTGPASFAQTRPQGEPMPVLDASFGTDQPNCPFTEAVGEPFPEGRSPSPDGTEQLSAGEEQQVREELTRRYVAEGDAPQASGDIGSFSAAGREWAVRARLDSTSESRRVRTEQWTLIASSGSTSVQHSWTRTLQRKTAR